MISDKKAIESAKIIIEYCKERHCQNCIFRQFVCDHWECHIDVFNLREVLYNLEEKRKAKKCEKKKGVNNI